MKIKSIRNTKISTKLKLLGVVSILGLLVLGSESVSTAWRIDQMSAQMSDVWMNAVIVAEEMNTATSDYRILELRHAIAVEPEQMEALESQMSALEKDIEEKFDIYRKIPTRVEDQQLINRAEMLWNQYLECNREILIISTAGGEDRAIELLMGKSQDLFNEASSLFLEAVEEAKQVTITERSEAGSTYQRLSHAKLLLIAVVSIVVIYFIVILIKAIKEPSEKLAEAAWRASAGNLDIKLDYESEDEMGILADAMNTLIQRLKDIINDETRMFQELGGTQLDVKSQCEQAYRGDFASVLYSFTSLQNRLKDYRKGTEREVEQLKAEIRELEKRIEEYEQK